MANRGNIPCETPGCGGTKAQGYLLCSACWRAVPQKVQRLVYSTFRTMNEERAHRSVNGEAALAAIKAYREAAAAATKAACASRFPLLAEATEA